MIGTGNKGLRTRRVSLLAGAVALLLQIVAWAWMPAMAAPLPGAGGGDGPSRIVICTPDGFKTVLLDAQGAPIQTDADRNADTDTAMSGGSCPLCPLIGGLALPPPLALLTPDDVGRHGPEALPGDRIAAGWFLSTLQARAPPSLG
ncbi:DUF2946 family protein [Azospirillum griseum]|uniref:DUF2946 domain-containing protein n=1 Tax=Azospirillum griseum TaxID=2496639 RepID=A0A431VIT0_9PROT|nr:DUF2946 family protein [Azospirillum griseum]RTR20207.1 DUF2946 domain-containing protein [Azospirillum griseum]